MFKACLLYDADKVLLRLKNVYKNWKLVQDWKIVRVHQEYRLYSRKTKERKKADVVWEMALAKAELSHRIHIVHEVKTGHFDINEVFYDYADFRTYKSDVAGGAYLWVWGWEKVIKKQTPSKSVENRIRYGGRIRLVPLDLIFPIVKVRLEEIGFKYVER